MHPCTELESRIVVWQRQKNKTSLDLFRGNNLILDSAYLCGTPLLTKFDSGNYESLNLNFKTCSFNQGYKQLSAA
jgi:hypothetical protein